MTAQCIRPAGNHYRFNDNFITTLTFEDGSVASLTYTALGSKEYAKETADLYCDGKTAVLTDYLKLDVYGVRGKSIKSGTQDKGHIGQLLSFYDSIKSGTWSIPWWEQLESSRISLAVESQLQQ